MIMIYDCFCEYQKLLIEFYQTLESVRTRGRVNYKVDLFVNI